mgnify:CR=1 FL=1
MGKWPMGGEKNGEGMFELLTGWFITTLSLVLGYYLGKHDKVVPQQVTKQIKDIFQRIVPNEGVGPIERPDNRAKELYTNPRLAEEQKIAEQNFDQLIHE